MLSPGRGYRVYGVLLIVALGPAGPACGEDSDADNEINGVPCQEAQDGDPCTTPGDNCLSAPGNCPYEITCMADNTWEFVCNAMDDVPCFGACT